MQRKTATQELMRECIFTALMLLMEKEDYDRITITDIAKRAGVSRMAYYRMYRSKDDILTDHMRWVFDRIADQVKEQKITTEKEFFICYYREVQKNTVFLKNVVKAGLMEQVWRIMKDYADDFYMYRKGGKNPEGEDRYRVSFFVGGILLLTREWLESGMNESVEEMASISTRTADALLS
ncbi:MAG TPA: TetR/AcrR family transcriptional regulator [Candidatus Mediterraneibacter cottocaccae]|nr:TetR/AcrR family transcriptional regulator [Candidatus Mediterraneibacter cottocaccae]